MERWLTPAGRRSGGFSLVCVFGSSKPRPFVSVETAELLGQWVKPLNPALMTYASVSVQY